MEKTIREWLEMLPEPHRTQAIENCNEGTMDMDCNSLPRAIRSAFFWRDAPQGHKYWNSVYDRAFRGEFNPKEPQP